MEESIYRKKNMDRISSPEELNAFLKVATPKMWLVIGAVALLLVGTFVWCIFGALETNVSAAVVSAGGVLNCYVPEDEASGIHAGQTVRVSGVSLTVTDDPVSIDRLTDDHSGAVLHILGGEDLYVCIYRLEGTLADGTYAASVCIDEVSPISFIVN